MAAASLSLSKRPLCHPTGMGLRDGSFKGRPFQWYVLGPPCTLLYSFLSNPMHGGETSRGIGQGGLSFEPYGNTTQHETTSSQPSTRQSGTQIALFCCAGPEGFLNLKEPVIGSVQWRPSLCQMVWQLPHYLCPRDRSVTQLVWD